MCGWFSPTIIERCLNSFSAIEYLKPEIYFYEGKSIHSGEIEKIVTANRNVKGYIQLKENFMTGAGFLAFEHFKRNFNKKYMIVTDGDLIISSTSVRDQINLFETLDRVGLISQQKILLGYQSDSRRAMNNYFEGTTRERHEDYDRVTNAGGNVMVMETQDVLKFRNAVYNKELLLWTEEPFTEIAQKRLPIWMDLDMSRFFEAVLEKQTLRYKKELCYELTSEEYNVGGAPWTNPLIKPRSEYLKTKFRDGNASTHNNHYADRWKKYANDWDFRDYCHESYYPDGHIKYDIII
jgi:hypothetical protein